MANLDKNAGMGTQYVFSNDTSPSADEIRTTMEDYPNHTFFFVYPASLESPPLLNELSEFSEVSPPISGYYRNEHGVYLEPATVEGLENVDSAKLLHCVQIELREPRPKSSPWIEVTRKHLTLNSIIRLGHRYIDYLANRNLFRRAGYAIIFAGVAILAGPTILQLIALHFLDKQFEVPVGITVQVTGWVLLSIGLLWMLMLLVYPRFAPDVAIVLSCVLIDKPEEIEAYYAKWVPDRDIGPGIPVAPLLDLRISNRSPNRVNVQQLVFEIELLTEQFIPPVFLPLSSIESAGHYDILFPGQDTSESRTLRPDNLALDPFEMVQLSAAITHANPHWGGRSFRLSGWVETDEGNMSFGPWTTKLDIPDAMYQAPQRGNASAIVRPITREVEDIELAGADDLPLPDWYETDGDSQAE